jgi:hypothetical protein
MSRIDYVEPPGGGRRGSNLKPSDVAEMASLLAEANGEKWVTDGESYPDRKTAVAKAQAYKRALAAEMSTDVKALSMRVWADGEEVRFALTRKATIPGGTVEPTQ